MLVSKVCFVAICGILIPVGSAAVSLAGDDVPGALMTIGVASHAAPSSPNPNVSTTSPAQAAEAAPKNFIEEIFSGVFGGNLAGTAESACLGSSFDDIRDFRGTDVFSKSEMARLQRATVRISFQSTKQIEEFAETKYSGKRYDLRELPMVGGKGTCTGTMIARNLVLTAGHCVDSHYYETEHKDKVKMPRIYDRRRKQSKLEQSELGLFLQADFNYQLPYRLADIAAAGDAAQAQEYSASVVEVISSKYEPPRKDYAILKLDPAHLQPSSYSVGLSNMELSKRPKRNQPVAIIQHPGGNPKKVATGTLAVVSAERLFYSNLSTEGGTSGAGILSRSGKLIGVHTRGGCGEEQWDPDGVPNANQGIRISNIRTIIEGLLKNGD